MLPPWAKTREFGWGNERIVCGGVGAQVQGVCQVVCPPFFLFFSVGSKFSKNPGTSLPRTLGARDSDRNRIFGVPLAGVGPVRGIYRLESVASTSIW